MENWPNNATLYLASRQEEVNCIYGSGQNAEAGKSGQNIHPYTRRNPLYHYTSRGEFSRLSCENERANEKSSQAKHKTPTIL